MSDMGLHPAVRDWHWRRPLDAQRCDLLRCPGACLGVALLFLAVLLVDRLAATHGALAGAALLLAVDLPAAWLIWVHGDLGVAVSANGLTIWSLNHRPRFTPWSHLERVEQADDALLLTLRTGDGVRLAAVYARWQALVRQVVAASAGAQHDLLPTPPADQPWTGGQHCLRPFADLLVLPLIGLAFYGFLLLCMVATYGPAVSVVLAVVGLAVAVAAAVSLWRPVVTASTGGLTISDHRGRRRHVAWAEVRAVRYGFVADVVETVAGEQVLGANRRALELCQQIEAWLTAARDHGGAVPRA